jgi:hypothetical protein
MGVAAMAMSASTRGRVSLMLKVGVGEPRALEVSVDIWWLK